MESNQSSPAPQHRLVGLRPYYNEAGITIYHADCAKVLPFLDPVDLLLTDPPYGDTSLEWDSAPATEWIGAAKGIAASIWCYGSMRFHMASDEVFSQAGYLLAQDVIWEKHNGSSTRLAISPAAAPARPATSATAPIPTAWCRGSSMPHEDMSEEEFCRQQLTRLRADFERAAKPWVDRLASIYARKVPTYLVVRAPDGSLNFTVAP